MTRRRTRRRRSGPPRCETCHQPIAFLTNPHTGRGVTVFDDRQVDGRTWSGPEAHPVEGRRAWRVRDLVEDLQIRRDCCRADAEHEAYAMPWQTVHRCPTRPTTEEGPATP